MEIRRMMAMRRPPNSLIMPGVKNLVLALAAAFTGCSEICFRYSSLFMCLV